MKLLKRNRTTSRGMKRSVMNISIYIRFNCMDTAASAKRQYSTHPTNSKLINTNALLFIDCRERLFFDSKFTIAH